MKKKKSPSYESKEAKSAILLNERARLTAAHPIQDYSLMNYIAYVTYTPLFIAGPIITFNDYVYQSKHTLPSINFKFIFYYAVRFVIALLSMEFILHFLHVVKVYQGISGQGDWKPYYQTEEEMITHFFRCHVANGRSWKAFLLFNSIPLFIQVYKRKCPILAQT